MITIFVQYGLPLDVDWAHLKVLLDEKDFTISEVELTYWGPPKRWPKPGWDLDRLNKWCLAGKNRYMRLSCEGYSRRQLHRYEVKRVALELSRSYIRQFWRIGMLGKGKRLMTLHSAYEDILNLPVPEKIKEDSLIEREGWAHLVKRIAMPDNVPFNMLGELGQHQM